MADIRYDAAPLDQTPQFAMGPQIGRVYDAKEAAGAKRQNPERRQILMARGRSQVSPGSHSSLVNRRSGRIRQMERGGGCWEAPGAK